MKKVVFYLPLVELNTVNSIVYAYLLGLFQEQGYHCYAVKGIDFPAEDTTSNVNVLLVNAVVAPRLNITLSFGNNANGEELAQNFYSFNSTIEALKISEKEAYL